MTMTERNNVAKPQKKANRIHQQLLAGLIETKPTSWSRKDLGKDKDGKEIVTTTQVPHLALRYPLAQNVSEESVERSSRKWI